MERSAGILFPIFSLPSNYGIGTFGKEAYKFVDFLKKSNQSYWQILPLGPIGYGNSPYSTYSIYAGNPYFIDLDMLCEDGLLKRSEIKIAKCNSSNRVNYKKIKRTREKLLRIAYERGIKKYNSKYKTFLKENRKWINDYSLYMSLCDYFDNEPWNTWPKDIRTRTKPALIKYKKLLKDKMEYHSFVQFLFYKQFFKLKKYMNKKHIKLIGDIPIYVLHDSCDVWVNPKCFKLTSAFVPKVISGCPPDEFCKSGQLWGNPIYNYNYMKKDNFKWWVDRIEGASKIYDVIRIDHFRGLCSYWAVPYGHKTARRGKWIKGPGMDLISVLNNKFKKVEFIAEDLGYTTDDVIKLVEDSGYPGMKVVQFGFDTRELSEHIPYSFKENQVCYVGTHDNATIMEFKKYAKKKDIKFCENYFNITNKEGFNWGVIRGGMESPCYLFMCQLQDYLGLDERARINVPGYVLKNNWSWRLKKDALTSDLSKKISSLTEMYGRGRNKIKVKKSI